MPGQKGLHVYALVASREMGHLICDTVVASACMDEDASSIAELFGSFIGKHHG